MIVNISIAHLCVILLIAVSGASEAAPRKAEKTPQALETYGPPPPPAQSTPPKSDVPYGPPAPEAWSPDELKAAAAECSRLMRGHPVKYQSLPPIREGTCGAPAPLKVEGFSTEPGFEIRPAATMTCKMTMALHEWVTRFVQPRAKELLHANIVRISNVASYHCRHRYNDPMQRISNHAYAGALDIAEFLTAKGERINVLEHWPLEGDARSQFLKDIHKGACQIFGTTLGPEANEAHANHFHLDVQERRKPFCDGVKEKRDKKDSVQAPPQAPDAAAPAPAQPRTGAQTASPTPPQKIKNR